MILSNVFSVFLHQTVAFMLIKTTSTTANIHQGGPEHQLQQACEGSTISPFLNEKTHYSETN